jgi:hypothetical protein
MTFHDSHEDYIAKHELSEEEMNRQVLNRLSKKSDEVDRKTTFKKVAQSIQEAREDLDKYGHDCVDRRCFVKTKDGSDAVVEPIISMWRTNKKGQLSQIKEETFEYFQEFKPTRNGEMMLQLSYDKSLVSIALVNEKYQQISVMAWNTSNLKRYPVSRELNTSLANSMEGTLLELSFISKNEYVLLVQKSNGMGRDERIKHLKYSIFNTKTGELVFKLTNKSTENINDHNLKFMGLLVQEQVSYDTAEVTDKDEDQ